ncbi:MAG: PRC-barrel domain-containing protein [Woeseia sp.]
MKKIMLAVASLVMAASLAVCAEEPDEDIVSESQPDTDRSMDERQQDPAVASDYDRERTRSGPADTRASQQSQAGENPDSMGMGNDLSGMTAEELKGKTVLTLTGEEIGEIGEVGTSGTQQERVATVEVGGFLGISEKTIAIPLSELQPSVSGEDSVKTSLTRTSIEARPEFDESGFTADDEDDGEAF